LRISSSVQTVALGLCGVLMMIARVRGLSAAAILSKSGRKVPGTSGTRTTLPPARSMLGT
jgi:hypothetical protein